ncbi:hypothetical protein T4A_11201 [Trichinella pseudospiralis]|uniref:Uncharacterized protein n=1 Tax=Trichinella pseudospiralis TaxID=6337 RepID=A0A0V1DRG8_TRIPS|nr:hypothetical protein T4A_11201 [Trichinella pseudospiralis]
MTLCIKSGKGISRGSKNLIIPDLGICHLYKKKTGIIHACSVPL